MFSYAYVHKLTLLVIVLWFFEILSHKVTSVAQHHVTTDFENYKPCIIMAEGTNSTLFWAWFLEIDVQETLLQFSVHKLVVKRACQNNC